MWAVIECGRVPTIVGCEAAATPERTGAAAKARDIKGGIRIRGGAASDAARAVIDVEHRVIVTATRIGAARVERCTEPVVCRGSRIVVCACAVCAATVQARAVLDVGVREVV